MSFDSEESEISTRKSDLYTKFNQNYVFQAAAVETLDSCSSEAKDLKN